MKREEFSTAIQQALESLHLIYINSGNLDQLLEFENKYTKDEASILETIRKTVVGIESELSEIKRLLPGAFNK